ncbi:NAD(P)/FAD-dependent oxidoreductase [Nonomuraea sp. NPDC050536]|uniref:NAD(P)/FAD-dependent oxidoreductase n=1 Tax=Nonomuraea sp. NPDC050536 TaxID=3364366 RepID=UPI0037C7A196
MGRPDHVVIVGASAAGLTAAETLRRQGHDGHITLIGEEARPPYDRPPLSKQILAGVWEPDRVALRHGELDLDLRLGTAATALDVAARTVTLRGGERLGFDGLIIATGVTPKRLPCLPDAHVLRTLDDALALRAALRGAKHLLVVGAGFLGAEAAASARTLGVEVTLVDPLPVPMARQFGERIGELVAELHREHGVDLRMNTGIARQRGDGAVELTDGTLVEPDLVLVAIGATPATGWLSGSGLTLDDGIVCDPACQAAPGIYAAGDVARWVNPRYGTSMRVEHRMNATEQAMAAAANLLGAARPFDPVPYFWTDQYDTKIQAYGHLSPDAEVTVVRSDVSSRRFVATYTGDGRVTGLLGWNMPRQLRELLREYRLWPTTAAS